MEKQVNNVIHEDRLYNEGLWFFINVRSRLNLLYVIKTYCIFYNISTIFWPFPLLLFHEFNLTIVWIFIVWLRIVEYIYAVDANFTNKSNRIRIFLHLSYHKDIVQGRCYTLLLINISLLINPCVTMEITDMPTNLIIF